MTNHASRFRLWIKRPRVLIVASTILGISVVAVVLTAGASRRAEMDRLAQLLQLHDGMAVAEIGAGVGWLTVDVARRVGLSGRVYSTELNRARLDDIRKAVAEAGLTNVTVIEAGERTTHLPHLCCDAIFMRRVYHHLGDPSGIMNSIREALAPGGRLVIIEFDADGLIGMLTRMGISRTQLIDQVTATGFEVVTTEEWPGLGHYVAVFEKKLEDPTR